MKQTNKTKVLAILCFLSMLSPTIITSADALIDKQIGTDNNQIQDLNTKQPMNDESDDQNDEAECPSTHDPYISYQNQ